VNNLSVIATIPEAKKAATMHALCPQISSYKELLEMDYYDVQLKLVCISAENEAMQHRQKEISFYAREGMHQVR